MKKNKISEEELRAAFAPEEEVVYEEQTTVPKEKTNKNGKKKFGIIVFILGIITLIVGVVFLLINLLKGPNVRDAEFLVQMGAWEQEDNSSVVWNFTEIGKGTLTTNFHINDYDFIWRIDGDRLKIETKWLYDLEDEYTYELDQGAKTLVITNEEESYTFVPAKYIEQEDAPLTEPTAESEEN